MSDDARICEECGSPIRGPGSVAAEEGQDLCLGCVHPVCRRERRRLDSAS